VDAGHKIVGIGHNKLPDGVDEGTFEFWGNRDIKKHGFMNTKYPYGECQLPQNIIYDANNIIIVCHAAIHAILNKNAENLRECTLFTTLFPSHEDAKMIIQAGIKKVVYLCDVYHNHTFTKIARKLFDTAVPCVVYTRYVAINTS
jgi:dCMP deaminase